MKKGSINKATVTSLTQELMFDSAFQLFSGQDDQVHRTFLPPGENKMQKAMTPLLASFVERRISLRVERGQKFHPIEKK